MSLLNVIRQRDDWKELEIIRFCRNMKGDTTLVIYYMRRRDNRQAFYRIHFRNTNHIKHAFYDHHTAVS